MARSTLSALVRATRPLAHGNIAPPILFGQALAFATTGHFSWGALALAQAFGVIDHLVIVFANDYADREADRLNTAPTPFSGGSRVLPDGELAPRTVRALAIGAAIALATLSLAAIPVAPAMPWLGLAALVLIGAYSYPPLRLSYRGGGELLQGLGVGVVLPLVGITAQRAPVDAAMLAWLVPSFVLGVAGNVLTSIPDEDADRAAGKASPAARWGGARARAASIVLHVTALALGAALLPGPRGAVIAVTAIATMPQLLALAQRDASAVVFVVLGGASEALALLGWAVALFFA